MRFRSFSPIAAAAAIVTSTGLVTILPAGAADLPAPPKVVYDPAPPVAIGGGWYLRGDIGVTQQTVPQADACGAGSSAAYLD